MKLNPDCARDILLSIEDACDFKTHWTYKQSSPNPKLFPKYSHKEILYHVRYCANAELIYKVLFPDNGAIIKVGDLTPQGHEFLANIRESKVWNGVKAIAVKVGSTSLDALTQIASNVITELIKAQFGITGGLPFK